MSGLRRGPPREASSAGVPSRGPGLGGQAEEDGANGSETPPETPPGGEGASTRSGGSASNGSATPATPPPEVREALAALAAKVKELKELREILRQKKILRVQWRQCECLAKI